MRFVHAIIGRVDLRRTPWVLLAAAVLLSLIGALFIASAESVAYARRHVMFLAAGVIVLSCVALFNYRHLAGLSVPLYAGGLLLLALLPIFGVTVRRATRWYDLG